MPLSPEQHADTMKYYNDKIDDTVLLVMRLAGDRNEPPEITLRDHALACIATLVKNLDIIEGQQCVDKLLELDMQWVKTCTRRELEQLVREFLVIMYSPALRKSGVEV